VQELITGKPGMTSYEFLMWRRFYNEKPFGEDFADYRAALSVKQLLAPHTKSEIPFDSFLLFPPEEIEETDQELLVKKCQSFFGTIAIHRQEEV
jgi:hypothetical protein